MNYVLGGVEQPRFLLCGVNYVLNGDFEVDTVGWTAVEGSSMQQRATDETDYGRYVIQVQQPVGGSSVGGIQYNISFGADAAGTTWAMTFALSGNDYTMSVRLVAGGVAYPSDAGEVISNTTRQMYFCKQIALPSSATGQTIALQFRTETNGRFCLDHVAARQIEHDYVVPNPNRSYEQKWVKELRSEYELIDGRRQEYLAGWRFMATLDFQYLEKTDEVLRTTISEAGHLIFFPHMDEDFFSNVVWDREFERRYAEVFVGHIGIIPLRGLELVREKPTD